MRQTDDIPQSNETRINNSKEPTIRFIQFLFDVSAESNCAEYQNDKGHQESESGVYIWWLGNCAATYRGGFHGGQCGWLFVTIV